MIPLWQTNFPYVFGSILHPLFCSMDLPISLQVFKYFHYYSCNLWSDQFPSILCFECSWLPWIIELFFKIKKIHCILIRVGLNLHDNLGRISIFNIFSPLVQKMLCLSIYLSSFMSPNRILKFSSFKFIHFLFVNAKTVDQFIVFKMASSTKFSQSYWLGICCSFLYTKCITFHFHEFYSCF